MAGRVGFVAALFAAVVAPLCASAQDAGPPREVGAVRADARILLTHRARETNGVLEPIAIRNVTVAGRQAELSWQTGAQSGEMVMARRGNRWWDALERPHTAGGGARCWTGIAAAVMDASTRHRTLCTAAAGAEHTIAPAGGTLAPLPLRTAGYRLRLRYTGNDAKPDARFIPAYGRAPTPGEFLPYPTPPLEQGPSSLFFFDLGVKSGAPVSFLAGSTLSVWFPFALDERVRYDLSIYFAGAPIGPISARLFDNTLTFTLPAFTLAPARRAHAEISGDW